MKITHQSFPLGDHGICFEFESDPARLQPAYLVPLADYLREQPIKGMLDVVPAMTTIGIYYDPLVIWKVNPELHSPFEWIRNELEKVITHFIPPTENKHIIVEIPVCYEKPFGRDLHSLSEILELSAADIIDLHLSKTYDVYMLGFLPGFPYMGETDERIFVNRKSRPVLVEAGSVAIAGNQTGIYPFHSPGGWYVIGKTPLSVFDAAATSMTLVRPGDRIQFKPISTDEFHHYPRRHT